MAKGNPQITGTWGYHSGVDGTLTVTGQKRVLAIDSIAGGSGATVAINSGDTITIPANVSLAIDPGANLVDPVVVFTGTAAYFVEFVS